MKPFYSRSTVAKISLLVFLFVISNSNLGRSKIVTPENPNVDVRLFLSNRYARRPWICNVENFKQCSAFMFEFDSDPFNRMFLDYNGWNKRLSSQDELNLSKGSLDVSVYSAAELAFSNDMKIMLYFDDDGNYFYIDKWHKVDYCLYYNLFKYFTNDLISKCTINDCKEKCTDKAKSNYRKDIECGE